MSNFAGIPVLVNPYIPKGEIWFFQTKPEIQCDELPQLPEAFEQWIARHIVRVFNLP